MKKVAIIGSREYPNIQAVRSAVLDLEPGTVIVTGGWWDRLGQSMTPTRGVDRIAASLGAQHHIVVLVAGPIGGGNLAGKIRNPTVADIADRALAFWDRKSKGTEGTVDNFRELGKPVRLYGPSGEEIA